MLSNAPGDSLVITGTYCSLPVSNKLLTLHSLDITPRDFTTADVKRDVGGRQYRLHYRPRPELLIITILTGTHELLHCELYIRFDRQPVRRRLEQTWAVLGGSRWQFDASDHDVKIVVLAKLHAGRNAITPEKWRKKQHLLGPALPQPDLPRHCSTNQYLGKKSTSHGMPRQSPLPTMSLVVH